LFVNFVGRDNPDPYFGKLLMKPKLYEFSGEGTYLGAVVLVVAKRKDAAKKLVKEWCRESKLNFETFKLVSVSDADELGIVFSDDGVY